MKLQNPGVPLTRDHLTAFEEKWNISLPEDYAAFLLQNNGGSPEEDCLFDFFDEVTERKNSSTIRDFYKIYPGGERAYDSLDTACDNVWEDGSISRDFLLIADDPGGNPICLGIAGENRGRVCFCSADYEDLDTGYLVMSPIAPSFSAFLNMLYLD